MIAIGSPRIGPVLMSTLLLVAGTALAAPPAGRAPAASMDAYRMDLTVTPAQGTIEGRVAIRYVNRSARPLPSLRFRLDANLNPGLTIELLAVEAADGTPLRWAAKPLAFGRLSSDVGAAEVFLAEALAPQADTSLTMRFSSAGRHIGADLVVLQDDPYLSLDAWYPKAMSPIDGGWSIDDDRPADYDVTLRLPAEFVVASTGRRVGEPARAGVHSEYRLQAAGMRGFTIFASPGWQRQAREAGPVGLAVYLPADASSFAERFLDAAADAIAFYEKEYGKYPATHLDVVGLGSMTGRSQGGSTDCGLIVVFLGSDLEQRYRFLVAHEVAHQYFSVNIGFPRDSTAWVPVGLGLMLDEHYSTSRGLDASWGRRMRDSYLWAERQGYDTTLSQSAQALSASPAPWSSRWNMALTHGKAYAVCAMLRDLMGATAFHEMVRALIRRHAGGIIREADLLAASEAALGEELEWFVAEWTEGRATFDYAIREVTPFDGGWTVEVVRVGTGSFPAKVELSTLEGQTIVQRVDRSKPVSILRFETDGRLKSVRLDPEGAYPDLNPADGVWPRAPASAPVR